MRNYIINAILILFALQLSACMATTKHHSQAKIKECHKLSHNLQKPAEWLEICLTNASERDYALIEHLRLSSAEELCSISRPHLNIKIQEIADNRKIDCLVYRQSRTVQEVSKLSMENLCLFWNEGNKSVFLTKTILSEVKKRNVDCLAMLTIIAQKQQARIQQKQFLSEQQKILLLQQQINTQTKQQQYLNTNAISSPPTYNTSCRSDRVGGVNCTTPPQQGLDSSIFNRYKSISDF